MPKLTIDGKEVEVPKGTRLIEAARKLGIEVAHYCYHPGLPIAGNCRMCLVEIEKNPKLQISCHIEAADGMVVKTQSALAKQGRQNTLEFLLLNHPVDCPVCDQAGECKLQDYYMEHGLHDPKFDDNKVRKSKKAFPIGPNVMLDTERCILCSRCVRFTDEITKTHEFGIFNRGDHSEVGLVPGKSLDNPYSANVVDICPVGALTDRDFRFKCRVWYLGKTPSVCTGCSRGCNIEIDYDRLRPHKKAGHDRIMRFKPRENSEVNKWWICDAGRYSYKLIDHGRLVAAKQSGIDASLDAALGEVAGLLAKAREQGRSGRIGVLASPDMTNEELFLVRQLFREELSAALAFEMAEPAGHKDDFLITADKHPNRAGAREILGTGLAKGEELLARAARGDLDALLVFHWDIAALAGADRLAAAARGAPLYVFATHENRTTYAARFALPVANFAEQSGTFTNCQGRVQRIAKAVEPLGESRPAWKILCEFSDALRLGWTHESAESVFAELSASVHAFAGMSWQTLGHAGATWKQGQPQEAAAAR